VLHTKNYSTNKFAVTGANEFANTTANTNEWANIVMQILRFSGKKQGLCYFLGQVSSKIINFVSFLDGKFNRRNEK
jgi:hypothetical protein